MLALLSSNLLAPSVIALSLIGLVLAASYCDASRRRIPNVLSLGGACWGVMLQLMIGGLDGVLFALAGWAVGFGFLIPGYALGKTGAGDVKLLAAVGTFIGPYAALIAAVATIISGAVMAATVALLAPGDRPWQRYASMFQYLWTTGHWAYVPPQRGEVMAATYPYAFAIAVGAIMGYWHYLQHAISAAGIGH